MLQSSWIILFFIIPLIGAFFSLLEKILPACKISKPMALLSLLASLFLTAMFAQDILNGRQFENVIGNWTVNLGISQMLDGTAWLGLAVMFTVSTLSMLFAFAEKQYDSRFYFFFLVLVAGMSGVLLASDLFNLFVCLEITSICAYMLIAYLHKGRAIFASFKYLILSSAGICIFLTGVFILYKNTGSLYIREIALYFNKNRLGNAEAVFAVSAIITGIGLRTAFIPFHTWLPDAHAYAPHPVSAVLSGVVIKVSFLAMWRLIFIFNLKDVQTYLLWTGIATALYGVIRALMQSDAKVLLAWHSVSQMGFILAGFGAGSVLSATGSLYHIISHSLFKSLLFLVTGSVIIFTGERSLKNLAGLGKQIPFTGLLFFIGALSISGIPPFNGYVSKKLILSSLSGSALLYWPLWAASAGTIASFIKLSIIFRGKAGHTQEAAQKPAVSFNRKTGYTAMTILALLCIVTGVYGNLISKTISFLVFGTESHNSLILWDLSGLIDTLKVIAAGILCYLAVISRPGLILQRVSAKINISFDWTLTLLFAGFLSTAGFLFLNLHLFKL